MAAAPGATLLAAGITAALAPGDSLFMLTVALVLLGVGWNFGLISGTALVVDSVPLADRAPGTQGAVDVLIAIAGASGGALSGWSSRRPATRPCLSPAASWRSCWFPRWRGTAPGARGLRDRLP